MANEKKNTVVFGASPNAERYAYKAVTKLKEAGHPVTAVGLRDGEINGVPIHTDRPEVEGVDTVTLYVGPKHQPAWFDYLLKLKPKRLILNPGTHNPELIELAKENNIEVEEACTLVLLSIDKY